MAPRLELQALFEFLFPDAHIYYQPPSNVTMSFPAIVYNLDFIDTDYGDNVPWYHSKRYQVTVIDANPDSTIVDMICDLPKNRYVRHYTTEGLNHNIFDLYF